VWDVVRMIGTRNACTILASKRRVGGKIPFERRMLKIEDKIKVF
jgi:hypothetical protein